MNGIMTYSPHRCSRWPSWRSVRCSSWRLGVLIYPSARSSHSCVLVSSKLLANDPSNAVPRLYLF